MEVKKQLKNSNVPQKLVIIDPNNKKYVSDLDREIRNGNWFIASIAPYGGVGSGSFLCVLEKKVDTGDEIIIRSSNTTLKDTLSMLNKKETETV